MRKANLLLALLLILSIAVSAVGEEIVIDGKVFVFPGQNQTEGTTMINARGVYVDEETFAQTYTELPDEVKVAVYTKDAQGNIIPLPDRMNGFEGYTFTMRDTAEIALPENLPLYLKVVSAPEGYAAGDMLVPVNGDCVELPVYSQSMSGVYLFIHNSDGSMSEGASFTLSGEGTEQQVSADENGHVHIRNLQSGSYTLTQIGACEGFSCALPVDFLYDTSEPQFIELTNWEDAVLQMDVKGFLASRDEEKTVPLAREYALLAEDGTQLLTVANGESSSISMNAQEMRCIIREEQSADGFEPMEAEISIVLKAGETETVSCSLLSQCGDFELKCNSGNGTYVLEDEAGQVVTEFCTDEDGHYLSDMIPRGRYTVRETAAARGCMYSGVSETFEVRSYLREGGEPAQVSLQLKRPEDEISVTADSVTCRSIYDEDVQAQIVLKAQGAEAVAFDVDEQQQAGVEITGEGDAVTISALRRTYVPQSEQPDTLTVSGKAYATVTYPVNEAGAEVTETFEIPFAVDAVRFEKPESKIAQTYGTVLWEDGKPAQGIRVFFEDSNELAQTDALGVFGLCEEGHGLVIQAPEGFGVTGENPYTLVQLREEKVEVACEPGAENAQMTLSVEGASETVLCGAGVYTFSGLIPQDAEISVEGLSAAYRYYIEKTADGAKILVYPASGLRIWVKDAGGTGKGAVAVTVDGTVYETDENGLCTVEELDQGKHEVSISVPEGVKAREGDEFVCELGRAETAEYTFVLLTAAKVEGVLTSAGEPAEGITLRLGEQNAVTGADGSFVFEQVFPGTYVLEAEGYSLEDAEFTIGENETQIRLAPSIWIPSVIEGVVWLDKDNDSFLTDTDSGLAGVMVEALMNGETVSGVLTDETGAFCFDSLRGGTYTVRVTLPNGLIFTKRASGMERLIADVDSSVGTSGELTLKTGETISGLSVGATEGGTICGKVWMDENADGFMDEQEPMLEGAVITVTGGNRVYTQTTGADGTYRFDNLRMGDYTVETELGGGLLFTRLRSETDAASDYPETDASHAIKNVSVRAWHDEVVVNAGAVHAADLQIRVWTDADADGAYTEGETGLAGLYVRLYDAGGSSERMKYEAQTDAQGMILFTDLRPGDYAVRVLGEEGMVPTTEEHVRVTLLEDTALGFGMTKPGMVSGTLYEDADNNGEQGSGEQGLRANVSLKDANGNTVALVRTNASGEYCFEELLAGNYSVQIELDDGWHFNDRFEETELAFALEMGGKIMLKTGAYQMGSVSGVVMLDADANGVLSSREGGVKNALVTLLTNDGVLSSANTDENGAFAFEGLKPGTYAVDITLPDGMWFAQDGDLRNLDTQNAQTDMSKVGKDGLSVRIGAVQTASVSGTCGQSGVLVKLTGENAQTGETRTAEDGTYCFDAVRPGKYILEFEPDEDWTLYTAEEEEQEVDARPGETVTCNARVIPAAFIGGSFWLDGNWNGLKEDGEPGVAGISVKLSDSNGMETETMTEADGRWTFEGLRPGEYKVSCGMPDGYMGNAEEQTMTLDVGEKKETDAIALCRTASLKGRIWEDLNSDASEDEDEPGVEGALITVLKQNGEIAAQVRTEADGWYLVEDLPPMMCRMTVTLPDGFIFTLEDDHIGETELQLAMDRENQGLSCAVLRSGRVGDTVWIDENGNGLQDTGEPVMEGVQVQLWRIDENGQKTMEGTATTDINGRYRFDNVRPGTVQVAFAVQDGYLCTVSVRNLPEIDSDILETRSGCWWTGQVRLLSGQKLLNLDAGLVLQKPSASEKPAELPTTMETSAVLPTETPAETPTAAPEEAMTAVPTEAPTAVPETEMTADPTAAPTVNVQNRAEQTEAPQTQPTQAAAATFKPIGQ